MNEYMVNCTEGIHERTSTECDFYARSLVAADVSWFSIVQIINGTFGLLSALFEYAAVHRYKKTLSPSLQIMSGLTRCAIVFCFNLIWVFSLKISFDGYHNIPGNGIGILQLYGWATFVLCACLCFTYLLIAFEVSERSERLNKTRKRG